MGVIDPESDLYVIGSKVVGLSVSLRCKASISFRVGCLSNSVLCPSNAVVKLAPATSHQARFFCQLVCSHLIYLILLASVNRLRIRGRPQPELRIAEVSVSVHVVQTFPHHFLLRQEALIRDQEVQLTLQRADTHTQMLTHHQTVHTPTVAHAHRLLSSLVCVQTGDSERTCVLFPRPRCYG